MPEPFTTVIGVGLLSYAKAAGRERPVTPRRLITTFEDHYSYRLDMSRNSTISYELSARRHGQLPESYPRMTGLQDNPHVVKAMRERAKAQSQYISVPFSKLEPPGLMKGPRLKDRAALATPRNLPNPKMSSIIT
ncbi:MAG: hypothetical protein A2Z75_01480 [Chloroflexi bacterium RBG_13_50_10]|nr:MAG: hypothetical protein A2Z75_01480 [Chloroflexi bacterium RBG_13_50_10]